MVTVIENTTVKKKITFHLSLRQLLKVQRITKFKIVAHGKGKIITINFLTALFKVLGNKVSFL